MEQGPDKVTHALWLGLGGLAMVLGTWLWLGSDTHHRPMAPGGQHSAPSLRGELERVNRHLQEADQSRRLREQDAKLHSLAAPRLSEVARAGTELEPADHRGASFDREDLMSELLLDLDSQRSQGQRSPAEKLNARLEKNQWLKEFETQERKLFIQEFVRRAEAEGWAVDVDPESLQVRVRGRIKGSMDR